jgi:hypothetical protein
MMERAVAIKKLTKLLGKKLAWRLSPAAPDAEARTAAREALRAAVEDRNRARELRDARAKAILSADEEYQRLIVTARAATEAADNLSAITRHYRITVGTNEGIFFLVKAEGDSWEDVISKLSTQNKAT